MTILYAVQRVTGDAGVVDAGWAGGLGAAAVGYALAGPGDLAYRLLLAAVAGAWSFRLAHHIVRDRVLAAGEDGRYQRLREHWGGRAQRNFFIFFQVQAGLVVLFSVPFLMVALRTGPGPGLTEWAGVAVGFGAIAGEAVADRQLRRWRRDPANRGKTCRAGLWRYSRHPNYFFEWLHWWAYVLLAASWPHVAGALLGPVLMLAFLYRLTGIPYTEQQALRSRGDDYRAYQRATSAFFPWPPKSTRP
jgi:steroid 5-alpha reductase family enzyme